MTAGTATLVRWVRGPQPKQLTCQQAAAAMVRGELTIVDVREHHERTVRHRGLAAHRVG